MTRGTKAVLGTGVLCLGLAASAVWADRSPLAAQAAPPRPSATAACARACLAEGTDADHVRATTPPPPRTAAEHNQVIAKYCAGCHNNRRPAAGLSLVGFDVSKAADKAEVAEKMIVKLQAGMMPPRAAQKPAPAAHAALVAALEHNLDAAAASAPNPGRRTFQRMNRPEYERAIKELLALDVNAGDWLPLDTKSANFDNIADAQALSPTLLESYLNAATAISRMAVGDRTAPTIDTTYTSPSYLSQHPWDHVEGAPYGTRGGIVVNHVFPADAEYEFQLVFKSGENARFEDMDLSIDGERIALLELRARAGGGRRRPWPGAAQDRADLRARRAAPGVGGVHPPHRRAPTRI